LDEEDFADVEWFDRTRAAIEDDEIELRFRRRELAARAAAATTLPCARSEKCSRRQVSVP